jgi:hypothetical protein
MRTRRPVIYSVASAAAIASIGLFASPAMASTAQQPWQGQGFSLYNNYGNARGTVTSGQFGQFGRFGRGSVTVSGTVSSYGYGYRHGTTEEVFLSGNSWGRGELIGSAGPGQSSQFSGSLSNTNSGTITLCAANRWGSVRDCTSQSFTVYPPSRPTPPPPPFHH